MTVPKRTAPSLALKVAALAYARAHHALDAGAAAIAADHIKRTGSIMGAMTTHEAMVRLDPLKEAHETAQRALCRAARALAKDGEHAPPGVVQSYDVGMWEDPVWSQIVEAADLTRYLADITEALGLPADATQQERLDRARALVAQPCCVTFTVPEDWKEPLPD